MLFLNLLMEKNRNLPLQEIYFGSKDKQESSLISGLVKSGKIRKIAPRLYTSKLNDPTEDIVRRNVFSIIGHLYPGAVLSHRSAFEFSPTKDHSIFLTYSYSRNIKLPGITLRFIQGSGPIPGDNPFIGELYVSQRERAYLENLQQARETGGTSKCFTLAEVEEKLELVIRVNGEEEVNELRDRARVISNQLGLQPEFEKLNKLIGALLSTKSAKALTSPLAIARVQGVPFDQARIQLFEELFRELSGQEFKKRTDRNETISSFRNFAFFESYFSNYIEGTEFEIDEAKEIISTNTPLPLRSEDSHDILGTYQLVSNRDGIKITPTTGEELLRLIAYRHGILLRARESKHPGKFKVKSNRAGTSFFVEPDLVRGTLLKGFDFYRALEQPFAKAAFMMFLISEVHPFTDGNGRIARVMMNAEMVKAGQSKIIIPTVYRDDYMGALKKLTKQSDTSSYIRMLHRAHEFSENIYGEDIDEMQAYLVQCNAFMEHNEGKLKIIPH